MTNLLVISAMLSLIPSVLVAAAWWRYSQRASGTPVPQWRLYAGRAALSLAALVTALELVFCLAWLRYGGGFQDSFWPPAIWRLVGRIGVWTFLASIALSFLGKGRWRLFIFVWALAVFYVPAFIFALELFANDVW